VSAARGDRVPKRPWGGSSWLTPRLASAARFGLVPLSLLVFGWLSVRSGQDANWDLRNYHFYNPWAFLEHRLDTDLLPAQAQTFFNPILDLPFYWLVTHASPRTVGFVLGAVQGLGFWLLLLIGLELLPTTLEARRALAVLAAGVGFFGPVGIGELGATRNDNLAGLFVLAGVYVLVLGLRHHPQGNALLFRNVLAAGAITGAGVGLKYSQVPYAVGLLSALALAGGGFRARLARVAVGALGTSAAFALAAGPWMLRLSNRFSSPLFPFLNFWFHSPYYDPGKSWNDQRWWPRSSLQWLLRPFSFASIDNGSMEYRFRDLRFAILAVLIVAALAAWLVRGRRRAREPVRAERSALAPLVGFAVVSFAAWEALLSYYRSLYPLEALAPLLIVALAVEVVRRPGWSQATAIALLFAIAAYLHPAHFERVVWGDSYFGVEVPPDPDLARAVVVLAGTEPTSYLLPFFPPGARFVRVASNFIQPRDRSRFQQEIQELLFSHSGPLFVLSAGRLDAERLAEYRIAIESDRCQPVVSRLEARPPLLCRAQRVPPVEPSSR
jgi:hypothetical protein